VRHLRAGQQRRRRHARLARPGAAARPTLTPEEILMSESQERMMAVVTSCQRRRVPGDLRQVGRRGDVIGEVTAGDRLIIDWHGERHRRCAAAHRGPRRPGLQPPVRPNRRR
jgi:hypothetical protein